jgi:hypothetical protein
MPVVEQGVKTSVDILQRIAAFLDPQIGGSTRSCAPHRRFSVPRNSCRFSGRDGPW